MNLQYVINVVNEMRKASAGNLTVGEMIEKLNKYDDNREFKFTNGKYLNGSFGSYRGYYEDLYIGYTEEDKGINTVRHLKEILNRALKEKVMFGYKGGEFPIILDTLVWLATYGDIGEMIVDILEIENQLYIITKSEY